MARCLVINADDFGQTDAITDGICRAARDGVLTSTTLMCNGGPSAERALRLARDLPHLGVGVHLNLTCGRPIAPTGRVGELLGPDGQFAHSPGGLLLRSSISERFCAQARTEWAAQIEWFFAHAGCPPTHLDSHKHVHAAPGLFAIACDLAADHGIRFIRPVCEPLWRGVLTRPCPPLTRGRRIKQLAGAQFVRLAFAGLARRQLTRHGLRSVDRFYGMADTGGWCLPAMFAMLDRLDEGATELMVHPGERDEAGEPGRLAESRPAELAVLLDRGVRSRIARRGVRLANYGQL